MMSKSFAKKILAFLLCMCSIIVFSSCGSKSENVTSNTQKSDTSAVQDKQEDTGDSGNILIACL